MAVSTNINVDYIPTGGTMVEQSYSGASSGWVGAFDLWTNGTLLYAGCLNEPEAGRIYTRSGLVTDPSLVGWVASGVPSGTQIDFLNIVDLNPSAYEYARTELVETVGTTETTTVYTGRNFSYTIPTGVDRITITMIFLPKGATMYVPNSVNQATQPIKIYVGDNNDESDKVEKMYIGSHTNRAIKVFED
jgi:hypothetical protein